LEAINDNTRIIVLLNPNNPMGNVYTEQEVQQIIEKAKSVNALVIIDEAYHYFYPKTFLSLALENDNVALLRTFSKLFSIAALRLGAIIANPNIIHYVQNAKLTFDVNSIALLFGERIIEHPDMIQQLIEIENVGKNYTISELKRNGYELM
jgi:histidinol-phosphate aminotransferase